ncbi:response regulator [Nevskia soli]|uniref:response regulator n=1 Tax=Nevskia soli TaxID=418856 RepID=UPI0015D88A32|nr:response regulator [Nevskia soli]
MSHPSTWHPVAQHATVQGITAAAIVLSVVVAAVLQPGYYLPLLAAAVLCTWLFGWIAGVEATLAGAILSDYFLVDPRYHWSPISAKDLAGLIIFVSVSLLVTWLTSAWRGSRDLQESILQGMRDALVVTDRHGAILYINAAAQDLAGITREESSKRRFESVFRLRDEATGADRSALISEILSGAAVPQTSQTLLTSKDGTEYSVEESAALLRTRTGRINGAIIVLRNTTQRRQMLDQLTQTQKMDAIARLAGGLAGEFNNLLTVITGFGELLTTEMAASNPLRRFAEEILVAAGRAAALTRRLLVFGKNHSIPAEIHDLNALITALQPKLARAVAPNVDLVLLPRARSGRIRTDPGQIESVLLNLAVNGSEAMPNGGKLIIETYDFDAAPDAPGRLPDLPPGQYVLLVITDNGVGMSAETRSRLFEPFFTTKTQVQSAGLGLSIVYAIVKQQGGNISVYSQPGAGTIIEIYFPRAKEAVVTPARGSRHRRGTETILMAEDEEAVRKLVHAVLATSGYRVIEAEDGKQALDMFHKNPSQIDLVLTDIVMPQMNGYQLAAAIEKLDPAKKILFMSGFRDASVDGEYENTRPFLEKPFTPEVLLKSVRETLDAKKTA